MTYHDNEVVFSASGYTIKSGSFKIEDFSITNGQDPDGKNKKGMIVSIGSDGKANFSVGRKGSTNTAKWFNERIPAENTTFNHTAEELNFAFLGTLTLLMAGGDLGGAEKSFVFPDICLAQGKSGASNNWWFGGKSCRYIGNNRVTFTGKDEWDSEVVFEFLRGGNEVNEVAVYPKKVGKIASEFDETEYWMKRISGDVMLNQLIMPGSHDAGMSEIHHIDIATPESFVKTQYVSVGEQLRYGSRYFDIRVDYDHNELVTYHRATILGTTVLGANGQTLKAVFDQLKSFLLTHTSETAIVKISHIRNDIKDSADTKKRIESFLNDYAGVMYCSSQTDITLANVTLDNIRGKMLVICDHDEYFDTKKGRFRYHDSKADEIGAGSIEAKNPNLKVYDKYSNTSTYSKMSNDQLKKWQTKQPIIGSDGLFLLTWTLTASVGGSGVETLAAEANSHLSNVLNEQINMKKWPIPNIVYVDFLTFSIGKEIIKNNSKWQSE